MFPGAVGTEMRPCEPRRPVSGTVPSGARDRGAASEAGEGRLVFPRAGLRAGGRGLRGFRKENAPQRLPGASRSHPSRARPLSDLEREAARRAQAAEGTPPPPPVVCGPGTQVSIATESGQLRQGGAAAARGQFPRDLAGAAPTSASCSYFSGHLCQPCSLPRGPRPLARL